MVRLHEQLKFFVNCKISTDPAWQGLRIFLSGHEVCDLRFLFPQLQFRLYLLERSTFNNLITVITSLEQSPKMSSLGGHLWEVAA